MVQLIKPQQVVVKTKTKSGECHITLDINIHLDAQGKFVGLDAKPTDQEEESDEFKWAIPDFQGGDFIEFGKDEEDDS